MMAVLEDSLKLIPEVYGEEVDLAHLPPDDPAVYDALQKADTIGMFQVESRAQMSCAAAHDARSGFTTSWCRWRSSAPARSSARWCIRT